MLCLIFLAVLLTILIFVTVVTIFVIVVCVRYGIAGFATMPFGRLTFEVLVRHKLAHLALRNLFQSFMKFASITETRRDYSKPKYHECLET
ncbi:hypothetical protein HBI88_013930 [Parastagonospora nodorum]|nr:hypothetical protein HBH48_048810 [Parastagonospora nodorum]KAH5272926.1 hypothetical protein HBI72_053550 [Parastagonospora nodorum]KAH5780768.1 hypothetical protein HBI97_111820 [Parastagonospora nodorum]KAH5802026.1 hypothetical protein HBI94_205970 [Parastagonospora nodorum]KAH5812002.1 hypothetical protein HBI93_221910 [Parastagonospora nodorum]